MLVSSCSFLFLFRKMDGSDVAFHAKYVENPSAGAEQSMGKKMVTKMNNELEQGVPPWEEKRRDLFDAKHPNMVKRTKPDIVSDIRHASKSDDKCQGAFYSKGQECDTGKNKSKSKCNGQFRRIKGLTLSTQEMMVVLRGIKELNTSAICERAHKPNCQIERKHQDRMQVFDPVNSYEVHNGFERNKGKAKNPKPELIIGGLSGWSTKNVLDVVADAFRVYSPLSAKGSTCEPRAKDRKLG